MKKVFLLSIALAFTSGCASTQKQVALMDYQFPAIKTTQAQAKAYLAELQLKKKRFAERQLLAKAPAFSDPEQIATQLENNENLLSECKGISKSDWAVSVLHGQNFLSYENHVETMERCFSQEKQASISDITTAMN